jgi:hypothetical protein
MNKINYPNIIAFFSIKSMYNKNTITKELSTWLTTR